MLVQGGLRLLSQQFVTLFSMERWMGKASFAQMFKAGARSIFSHAYRWMQGLRARGRRRAKLDPGTRDEVFMFCMLAPFLQFSFKADWNPRVEMSDASPGGHGRAWATMPLEVVRGAAQAAETKGFYTSLAEGDDAATGDL